jgi:hypothetical protein
MPLMQMQICEWLGCSVTCDLFSIFGMYIILSMSENLTQ